MNEDLKKYIEATGSAEEIDKITEPEETEEVEVSIFDDIDDANTDTPEEEEAEDNSAPESVYPGDADVESEAEKPGTVKFFILLALVIAIVGTVIVLAVGSDKSKNEENANEEKKGTAAVTEIVTEPADADTSATEIIAGEVVEIDPYRDVYLDTNRATWGLYNGVVGQLQIPNVEMDYLVFQGADNEEFLYINEFGEEDKHGCIFGDYRNNFDNLDENNVLYGHNMADGSRFAKLLKLRDEGYYSQDADFYIYFNSEGYNNIFKIFSVYETDLTSFNFIQTGFDEASKAAFMQTVRERNELSCLSPYEVPDDAKVLTLSTCTKQGTHRLVVQAYLLAREVV